MSKLTKKDTSFYQDAFLKQPTKILNFTYFFGDLIKVLNNRPPISPPYNVLFNGFEVIMQLPLKQPISA